MRAATARAAMRRGSSIRIFLPRATRLSSRASGTMVLLPAPGGACSSTRVCAEQRLGQARGGPRRSAATAVQSGSAHGGLDTEEPE